MKLTLAWYAIECILPTKKQIEAKLVEHGFKKELRHIKKILTFDFERDTLWLEHDDSILNGYALLQVDSKNIAVVTKMLEKSKVGSFFDLGKDKLPTPIPEEQVKDFKEKIKDKKQEFYINEPVVVTEGILNGLAGVIKGKKKLMVLVEVNLPHRTVREWVNILSVFPQDKHRSLN
jgi:transcription antitermination factor NusG